MLVILVAGALVLYLFAWPFIAAFRHVQAETTTTLATVMGAVFTAGGLVVAMVSLVTLAAIRREISSAVERVRQDVREELSSETSGMLRSFSLFLKAQSVRSLDEAEQLVEQAIAHFGPISGARYYVGSLMHQEARDRFLNKRETLYSLTNLSAEAMAHRAVAWLAKARDVNDGATGKIMAMLAECYGILGPDTTQAMFRALQVVLDSAEDVTFCRPCLVHGCGTDRTLAHLNGLLGGSLLLDRDGLAGVLTQLLQKKASVLSLWCIPMTPSANDPSQSLEPSPGRVIVNCYQRADGQWGLRASWRLGNASWAIPVVPDNRTDQQNFVAPPLELTDEIAKRFWVLAPHGKDYTKYVEVVFSKETRSSLEISH